VKVSLLGRGGDLKSEETRDFLFSKTFILALGPSEPSALEDPVRGFISSPFCLLIRLSFDDSPPWRSDRDGRGVSEVFCCENSFDSITLVWTLLV